MFCREVLRSRAISGTVWAPERPKISSTLRVPLGQSSWFSKGCRAYLRCAARFRISARKAARSSTAIEGGIVSKPDADLSLALQGARHHVADLRRGVTHLPGSKTFDLLSGD